MVFIFVVILGGFKNSDFGGDWNRKIDILFIGLFEILIFEEERVDLNILSVFF